MDLNEGTLNRQSVFELTHVEKRKNGNETREANQRDSSDGLHFALVARDPHSRSAAVLSAARLHIELGSK